MLFLEIKQGNRAVIATRNDEESRWHARLYVNARNCDVTHPDATATNSCGTFKTEAGVRRWASKHLTA